MSSINAELEYLLDVFRAIFPAEPVANRTGWKIVTYSVCAAVHVRDNMISRPVLV